MYFDSHIEYICMFSDEKQKELNVKIPVELLYREDLSLGELVEISSKTHSEDDTMSYVRRDSVLGDDVIIRHEEKQNGDNISIFLTGKNNSNFSKINHVVRCLFFHENNSQNHISFF